MPADRHQFVAAIFDLLIQIRLVLEGVQVDIAFAQRFVWQHVIVEGDQLDVQTVFLFRHFLRHFSHLLLCADDHADLDVVWILFILATARQSQSADQCANCRDGFKMLTTYPFLIRLALICCETIYG